MWVWVASLRCLPQGWWQWPLAAAPGVGAGRGHCGMPVQGCWQCPMGRKTCQRHCTGQDMPQGAGEAPGASQDTGLSPSHRCLLAKSLLKLLLWELCGAQCMPCLLLHNFLSKILQCEMEKCRSCTPGFAPTQG